MTNIIINGIDFKKLLKPFGIFSWQRQPWPLFCRNTLRCVYIPAPHRHYTGEAIQVKGSER